MKFNWFIIIINYFLFQIKHSKSIFTFSTYPFCSCHDQTNLHPRTFHWGLESSASLADKRIMILWNLLQLKHSSSNSDRIRFTSKNIFFPAVVSVSKTWRVQQFNWNCHVYQQNNYDCSVVVSTKRQNTLILSTLLWQTQFQQKVIEGLRIKMHFLLRTFTSPELSRKVKTVSK